MDTLIWELVDIGEKVILKMPEMLLGFNSYANSVKGIARHLLVFQGNGPIVDEGLQSLIFTLRHHLQLMPACVPVISLISVDVEGFQVVKCPGVEDFPVLWLMGGIKVKFGGFPAVNRARGHS